MHEALQRIQVILPNQKEGDAAMQHGLITSRQQKNSKWRELRIWKQSPLDSDHVLTLNVSLTIKE